MSICCTVTAVSAEQAQELADNGEALWELDEVQSLNLDTSWQGMLYLLTGTIFCAPGPFGFLVDGGRPLDGTNAGYGEARLFGAEDVATIDAAIHAITEEQLLKRCEPPREGEPPQNYPIAWGHEGIRGAYLTLFKEMREFITDAHRRGRAIVVDLR